MTSSLLPSKWLGVAQHVYDEYLSKPFTSKSVQYDWEYTHSGVTIPRPNHGLVHTLRTAAYVSIVVKSYNFFTKSSLSDGDISRIQLALLFYVVGRENEAAFDNSEYVNFRQKAGDAFEKYVRKNLLLQISEDQIQFYKKGIVNVYSSSDPQYLIMRICHDLDLLRCYSRDEFTKKLQEVSPHVGPLTTHLAELAEECIRKTGDRVTAEGAYNGPRFILCSTNVEKTLRKIDAVFQLKLGVIMSILNPIPAVPPIPLDLRRELPDPATPWNLSDTLFEAMQPPAPKALYKKAQLFPEHKEWRFIWRYFHQQKPIRYGIKHIFAISERHQRQTFEFNFSSIEREATQFPPSWKTESRPDQRAQAIDRWRESTQAFSPFHTEEADGRIRTWKTTKVLPLWHGTNDKTCDSICSSGFVYFGKNTIPGASSSSQKSTDDGYFGSGIYFTNSAQYAADIYSKGHLILAWVSMREPFPVVGDSAQTDMKNLRGKGAYKTYNAHYVPVAPEDPSDPYCSEYYPLKLNESPTCDEYVVFHKSQTLPQFWIELEVEYPHLMVPGDIPQFVSELTPHLMKMLQNPHVDKDLKLRNILSSQLGILLKLKPDDDLTEDQQQLYKHMTTLLTIGGVVNKAIRESITQTFASKPMSEAPKLLAAAVPISASSSSSQNIDKVPTLDKAPAEAALVISVSSVITPSLPAWVFGASEWNKYFGDVGVEPPLPKAIIQRLPELSAHNVLVLIPATVNGHPLTLKTLGELVKSPHNGGKATKYHGFKHGKYVDKTAKSHWALLTRTVIEESRNKSLKGGKKILDSYSKKTKITYETPTVLDATVCNFMEYVRSGTWLYGDSPWTYTFCQEMYDKDHHLVVGGGSAAGLYVDYPVVVVDESCGVGGLRKF